MTADVDPVRDVDSIRDALVYIADLCEGVVATLKRARDLDSADEPRALAELLTAAASDALEALGHLQAMTGDFGG